MSFFNYRWDKCRVLAIGGTYIYLTEGGTNVGGTNVGWTNVGGKKVAASVLPTPIQKFGIEKIFFKKKILNPYPKSLS